MITAPRIEFSIVDAAARDIVGICDIYNQAVRETFSIWSETETTPELRKRWMDMRRADGFPVLAARDGGPDGTVLGYGSFGVFRDFPGFSRTVEHSVYVAPPAQGRGVGRALLGALIEAARQRGLSAMVGAIDSTNEASLALHRKLGFEEQGRLTGVGRKFGQRLDLVFMVRQVES